MLRDDDHAVYCELWRRIQLSTRRGATRGVGVGGEGGVALRIVVVRIAQGQGRLDGVVQRDGMLLRHGPPDLARGELVDIQRHELAAGRVDRRLLP